MIDEIKRAIENSGAQSVIIFKAGGVHVVTQWGAGGYSYAQFQEWVIKHQGTSVPATADAAPSGVAPAASLPTSENAS
jgi:hypothetical protein